MHEINDNDSLLYQQWDVSFKAITVLFNHVDEAQEITNATQMTCTNQQMVDIRELAIIGLGAITSTSTVRRSLAP